MMTRVVRDVREVRVRAGRGLFCAYLIGLSFASLLQPADFRGQEPGAPKAESGDVQPDGKGIYPVGGGVAAPKLTYSVLPEFSEGERKRKIRGTCRLSLVVGVDGHVDDVRIVRSVADDQPATFRETGPALDEEVLEAVRHYRYHPALFEGKPVPVLIHVDVKFEIF